ncbi:MAG: hypothetical protein KAV00_12205 [Phycisphaerae bacterium]|nr:hypothetical protein [Phycisphaerae bacterium]
MSSQARNILIDIRDTLRVADLFAAVTIGTDADSAQIPRAEVNLIGVDESLATDSPSGRWYVLRAKVCVHVRCHNTSDAFARALDLSASACEALLADRFRTNMCMDLPTGKATETGPLKIEPKVKKPYLAVTFEIRCNFESEASQ